MKNLAKIALLIFCCTAFAAGQEKPQAFVGATIIPIVGQPITDGVLIIQNGKIVSIGARNAVKIPAGTETFDASGKFIMPGLVDTHSHIGGGAGADNSSPIQPDVRILDAIDVLDDSILRARAGGITTVNVMPGSGHLVSGQTIYIKLRDGRTIDDLMLFDSNGKMMGGIKFANGTNPLRPNSPPFPSTRAKSAALVREQLVKAQEYREKIRRAGNDKSKLPTRDLAMEALVEVLDGKRMVHFHTHRHDDIMTVLRLKEEFGFRLTLHHVTEGWKVADEIARLKVFASIIFLDAPGGKLEAVDFSFLTGVMLDKAGALVAYHTDDYITDSRFFLRSAAMGVRGGLSRERALNAMTLAGAKMLDLDSRIGSLEKGKDADFIVLSGDPLSVYTKIQQTFIEGKKVFDRTNSKDFTSAVGGYKMNEIFAHSNCFIDSITGGLQ